MKRILCLVLSAVLILGLMGVGASAEGTVKLVMSSATAAPGEEVEVILSIENNPSISGISGEIIFDDTVLTYVDYTAKTNKGVWSMDTFAEDHVILWYYDGLTNAYTGTELISLKFKVAEDAQPGEYPVTIVLDPDWDAIVDENNNAIEPFEIVPGTVIVTAPETETETAPETAPETETGTAPETAPETETDDSARTGAALTAPAEVYGSSVSLKGSIGLNFFLILPEELLEDEGLYVTLNDARYMASEALTRVVGEDTLYQFSISLAAKQMNDDVTLRVYTGADEMAPLCRHSDGVDLTETGYVNSVQGYIRKALENNAADGKLKALALAMSDYGSLAQLQFGYNTADRAEVKGDLNSVTADTVAAYKAVVETGTATGLEFKDGSLALESETAIRLNFELAEGSDINDFTFEVGSTVETPTEEDGKYYIEIPDISAKDLDKTFTVKVTSSEGTVVTVKYSALSYVYSVLSGTENSDDPAALVRAIYLYNQAANAYFA